MDDSTFLEDFFFFVFQNLSTLRVRYFALKTGLSSQNWKGSSSTGVSSFGFDDGFSRCSIGCSCGSSSGTVKIGGPSWSFSEFSSAESGFEEDLAGLTTGETLTGTASNVSLLSGNSGMEICGGLEGYSGSSLTGLLGKSSSSGLLDDE